VVTVNEPATAPGMSSATAGAPVRAQAVEVRGGRMRRARHGFSMVELVVTMVVVAIVTVTVTMGSTAVLDENNNRAAQSNVQRVLIAQQTFATKYGTYTGFPDDLGQLTDIEVSSEVSDDPSVVSIALGVDGTIGIASRRDERTCVMVAAAAAAAGGAITVFDTEPQACDAAAALGSEAEADGGVPVSKLWTS
jgi:prepilin-type N-terminal cleavage/methylation domain-containing protein